MVTAERRINRPSLTAKPKARLRMGSISGATIMAPITTAVLLEISPRVAITAELIRRMKKPSDGLDEAIRASYSSVRGTRLSRWTAQCPDRLSSNCPSTVHVSRPHIPELCTEF